MPSPTDARIVVVTVNYRTADMVADGWPALAAELSAFREGVAMVVDNASPDGDADVLERRLAAFEASERIRLIRSERNGGFAAGNNVAFAAMSELGWTPDYVMLLNPDARVRPGAIRELLRVMTAHPKAGVVGAALENPDGSEPGAAFVFPSIMGEFARGVGIAALLRIWPIQAATGASPTQVDWVPGAAMLMRREMLDEIGWLDEGYFLYFEEIDFMRKVARAGWDVWYAPDARVLHDAGSATGIVGGKAKEGRMPRYWYDSWFRYFALNHGVVYARATAAMRLIGTALGVLSRRLRGRETAVNPGFFVDFTKYCLLGSAPHPTDGKGS